MLRNIEEWWYGKHETKLELSARCRVLFDDHVHQVADKAPAGAALLCRSHRSHMALARVACGGYLYVSWYSRPLIGKR